MIEFTVLGTPAPKGSSRAFVNKATGRAILAPSGSAANKERLKSWNAAVREAAAAAVGKVSAPPFVLKPIVVTITFRLCRPADHWSARGGLKPWAVHAMPMFKPDGDKLQRCTLDALKGTVYDDDSRICRYVVDKVYAAPGQEGATIRVEEIVVESPMGGLSGDTETIIQEDAFRGLQA